MSVMTASPCPPSPTNLSKQSRGDVMMMEEQDDDSNSNVQYLKNQPHKTAQSRMAKQSQKKATKPTSQDQHRELETSDESRAQRRSASCKNAGSKKGDSNHSKSVHSNGTENSKRDGRITSSTGGNKHPKKTPSESSKQSTTSSTSKSKPRKKKDDGSGISSSENSNRASKTSSKNQNKSSLEKSEGCMGISSSTDRRRASGRSATIHQRQVPVSRASFSSEHRRSASAHDRTSRASFTCGDEKRGNAVLSKTKALELCDSEQENEEEDLLLPSSSDVVDSRRRQSSTSTSSKQRPAVNIPVMLAKVRQQAHDDENDSLSSYEDEQEHDLGPGRDEDEHDQDQNHDSFGSTESNFSQVREKRKAAKPLTGHQEPQTMTKHDVGNLFSMALPLVADEDDEEGGVASRAMPPKSFRDDHANHVEHEDEWQESEHPGDEEGEDYEHRDNPDSEHPGDDRSGQDHSEDLQCLMDHPEYSEVDLDVDDGSYSLHDEEHADPSTSHSHQNGDYDDESCGDGDGSMDLSDVGAVAEEKPKKKQSAGPSLLEKHLVKSEPEEDPFDGHDSLRSSIKVATAVSKFKKALLLAKEAKSHAKKYHDEHDTKTGVISNVDTTKKEPSRHSNAPSHHSKSDHVVDANSHKAMKNKTAQVIGKEPQTAHIQPNHDESGVIITQFATAAAHEDAEPLAPAEIAETESGLGERPSELQKMKSFVKRTSRKPSDFTPADGGDAKRRMVARSRTDNPARPRRPSEGGRLPPRRTTDDGILRTRAAPAKSATDDDVPVKRAKDSSLPKLRGGVRRTMSMRNSKPEASGNSDATKDSTNHGKLPGRSQTCDELRIPRRKKPLKALSSDAAPVRRMKRPNAKAHPKGDFEALEIPEGNGNARMENGSGKSDVVAPPVESETAKAFAASFLKMGASKPENGGPQNALDTAAEVADRTTEIHTNVDPKEAFEADFSQIESDEEATPFDEGVPALEADVYAGIIEATPSAREQSPALQADFAPFEAHEDDVLRESDSEYTDNDDEPDFLESHLKLPLLDEENAEMGDASYREEQSDSNYDSNYEESDYAEEVGDGSERQRAAKEAVQFSSLLGEPSASVLKSDSNDDDDAGDAKKKKKKRLSKFGMLWKNHGHYAKQASALDQSEMSLNTKGLLEELEEMNAKIQQDVAVHPVKPVKQPTTIQEEGEDDENGIDDSEVLEALRRANEMMELANNELLEATLSHPLPSADEDMCDDRTIEAANVVPKRRESKEANRERQVVDRVRQRRITTRQRQQSLRDGGGHRRSSSPTAVQRDSGPAGPARPRDRGGELGGRPRIRRTKSFGDDGVGDAIARRQMRALIQPEDAPVNRSRRAGHRPSHRERPTGGPAPTGGPEPTHHENGGPRRPSRATSAEATHGDHSGGPSRRARGVETTRHNDNIGPPRRVRQTRTKSNDGLAMQSTHLAAANRRTRPATVRRMSDVG